MLHLYPRILKVEFASEKLISLFDNSVSKTTVYAGFDPTATSLHVGNLLSIIALLHFHRDGHNCIALIGGATGLIGDPSGRSTERNALEDSQVSANASSIKAQLSTIVKNATDYIMRKERNQISSDLDETLKPIVFLDNKDWFSNIGLLEFLRDVGRFSRVSIMMSRDSVKNRLESPEGISFTEFTYQLLQAFDFYHLYNKHNCRIQIGGSDQWGNIVAGIDLIRRKNQNISNDDGDDLQKHAFGVTIPLLTTATGEKFGKTAGNAVWLDSELLSVLDFYQFFRRTADSEVEKLLKSFTFLSLEEIDSLMDQHSKTPEKHIPQRKLAFEITDLVHGYKAAKLAKTKSELLFDGYLSTLVAEDIFEAFEGDDRLVTLPKIEVVGKLVVEIATKSECVRSISAGRKLVKSGGLYVNNQKVLDANEIVSETMVFDQKLLLIRSGKSNHKIIRLE